jgi:hypothetical protein
MTLTLRQLKMHVISALGGAVSTQLSVTQIINEAGTHMLASHSWAFRRRPEQSLTFTASQSYVLLPYDFGEFAGAPRMENSTTDSFMQTSMGELLMLRQSVSSPTTTSYYYGAISFPEPSNRMEEMRPRLELWPTPSSAAVLKCGYRARWIPLWNATDAAHVPDYCEALLSKYVRAFAKMYEEDYDAESESALLAPAVQALLQTAKENDGLIHGASGPLRNGLVESGASLYASNSFYNRSGSASNPS